MKRSELKGIVDQFHELRREVRTLRAEVRHTRTVNEGLAAELHRERDERIEQLGLVTNILGALAADLEHRARQVGADSEVRAIFQGVRDIL